MTKQFKIYLLVALTLIIWGIIGFQIYKGLSSNNQQRISSVAPSNYKYNLSKQKTAIYTVVANYRDPFFGGFTYARKQKRNTGKRSKLLEKKKTLIKKILFNGTIERGNNKIYVLTIDNKQELFQVGSTINEVTLLKGTDNTIMIRVGGVRQTINIQ